MSRAVLVGRHSLLPVQQKMLEKLGIEVAEQIAQLPNEPGELSKLVASLRERGIEVVVVQALPLPLLAQLVAEARRNNMRVLTLKMETIATVPEEEAKKLVAEKPEARAILPGRPGEPARVVEAKAITEVKEIRIVEETLITAEQV